MKESPHLEPNDIDLRLVTQDRIDRLLSFIPCFDAAGSGFGLDAAVEKLDAKTLELLPSTLSGRASDFFYACYDAKFVQDFDWQRWGDEHEADLRSAAFIGQSDLAAIVRLLTVHFRTDRFCDGHLLSVMRDGTIRKILSRLNEISSQVRLKERHSMERPIQNISDMLARCSGPENDRSFPPTILYNEGWMLRLVLAWFAQAGNRMAAHPLGIPSGCRWYSEALLPSRFKPRKKGDRQAESHTHADGVIGQFRVGGSGRGDLCLLPEADHLVVLEAKMFSPLSAGTKNAPAYNQAARNVACIANALTLQTRKPTEMKRLGFFVLAPESHISERSLDKVLGEEAIRSAIVQRVDLYRGQSEFAVLQEWISEWVDPTLARLAGSLRAISWESVIDDIDREDTECGQALKEFYALCKRFNPRPRLASE